MNLQTKPLVEITDKAITILTRELGVADTIRFLNQFYSGYGDYTAEREEIFKDLTLEEFHASIEQLKAEPTQE